jgi:hypothetical protein
MSAPPSDDASASVPPLDDVSARELESATAYASAQLPPLVDISLARESWWRLE